MTIDPTYYGLHSRTKLEKIGHHHLAIVKLIKSRIIKKEALKIIESAEKIKNKAPGLTVSLICTSNICSKSVKLLTNNQISVIYKDEKAG